MLMLNMNGSTASWFLINIVVDDAILMIHWSTLELMMIWRRRPMILISYWSRLMRRRRMNLRRRLKRNAQRKI